MMHYVVKVEGKQDQRQLDYSSSHSKAIVLFKGSIRCLPIHHRHQATVRRNAEDGDGPSDEILAQHEE